MVKSQLKIFYFSFVKNKKFYLEIFTKFFVYWVLPRFYPVFTRFTKFYLLWY